MFKHKRTRWLAILLSFVMIFGVMSPVTSFASETQPTESTAIADYSGFLDSLKVLEGYADSYALTSGEDPAGLVINYIRTGIEKYNTDSWAILAGAENTAFTAYVTQQDEENGTNAQGLRGIGIFTIPNGQTVEFAHMFAAMNIAQYNSGAVASADFGGWAGDICDLMEYSKDKVTGTDVETMAAEIRENYLGIDDENAHSFGKLDIYGDLDAFYIMNNLSEGSKKLSSIMKSYYTAYLTDESRALYFLKNRFAGETTQEEIRNAVLDAYKGNSGVTMLEAERGLTGDTDLRTASCYAFADYLYDLAKDKLGVETEETNPYYTVFSSEISTLAPGITQVKKQATTADDKQIAYYIATADLTREDVHVFANYKDNTGGEPWAMYRVTDQMAAAQKKHSDPEDMENYIENYNTIVGVNADFYNMTTGQPSGALVMEGIKYQGVGNENFFGILKDGTPVIGGNSEWSQYEDQIQEAVGASIYLVRNGEIAVTASADYYNSRASRTCVGITADNKVIFMVLDGRQEPFSAGGSAIEIAQIMLDAGCVTAVNLDGGGSSTFVAKEEGKDGVAIVNRPSDGYERSVSSSLMIVSTAKTSDEFDHAVISTETSYFTVGSSLNVTVSGVSESGNAAEIPAGAVLRSSDESIATVNDNVVTALANGDVTLELAVNDRVVGKKKLHVVVPDSLTFEKESLNVIYGVPTKLPLKATYDGNVVSINENDIITGCEIEEAGVIDGFMFTGIEESGIRTMLVAAVLTENEDAYCEMRVHMYKNGEAIFDFDSATDGDQSFAWKREVSNATTSDEKYYHIVNPDEEMNVSYIFGLDMKEIEIPEAIKPLISLLPGGDSEDATAWDFLLQLAERVSVLTEVKVELQVDPNLDFDFSEMTLVNEYFTLTSKDFDEETNTLTVVCNWIDQTQAIDAATANSICILSGIKAKPKNDARWDEENCLQISNSGKVSYDIYLRSSTLYGVASDAEIQKQYGIYPFVNPNDSGEKGGHFGTTYKTFEDSFTLDKTILQGWLQNGKELYYYVDNKPVTGIRKVPGYNDEGNTYYYNFGEDGISQGKVTGLFELNGNKYYAQNGVLKSEWWIIPDEDGNDQYYYFDPSTFAAVDGAQKIKGYNYIFEGCKLVRGELCTDENGTRYRWADLWTQSKWITLDGNTYYFGPHFYALTGVFSTYNNYVRYVADENGIWQSDYTGLYDYNGGTYYCENGILIQYPGLVKIGDDYYYFNSSDTAVKGRTYWITKTNDLLSEGYYTFDEAGKMINPPVTDPDEPEPEVKNGIVAEVGSLYYYVDGVRTYAGLIQIDGNYYYIRSSGEVVHGRDYWITKTNGLLPEQSYHFDDDGKMTNPPVTEPDPDPIDPTPEVKNGIVEENGSLYYYVDGVLTYGGLIQIDGNYYYVRSNGEVVHGRDYWITKTNSLLPEQSYHFGDDGKMTNPPVTEPDPDPIDPTPEVKNGIVEENGGLYYYVDGVLTYGGLIQIDGNYYYVRSSGEVVHGRTYWVTKTNGLLPEKIYTFDDSGKIIDA